jgi:hypothetical protein
MYRFIRESLKDAMRQCWVVALRLCRIQLSYAEKWRSSEYMANTPHETCQRSRAEARTTTYQAAAHATCRLCSVKLTASTSIQLGTRFPALYVSHVLGYAYCYGMNCRDKYHKRSAYFELPLSTRRLPCISIASSHWWLFVSSVARL